MSSRFDVDRHRRRSLRLEGYDYSRTGLYFVTVCAFRRENRFGEVVESAMVRNPLGEIVARCWQAIPDHFPGLVLDEWVVMPNHLHGILVLDGPNPDLSGPPRAFEPGPWVRGPRPRSLGAVLAAFKSAVTRDLRRADPDRLEQVWQRNYYEHVIRNDEALGRIRQYIADNPSRWNEDEENPDRRG